MPEIIDIPLEAVLNDPVTSDYVLTILRDGRDIVTPPERWTTGWFARDASGKELRRPASSDVYAPREAGALEPNACSFCARGAVVRAAGEIPNYFGANGDNPASKADRYLVKAAEKLYVTNIVAVNDNHGHFAVLACFDEAIAQRLLDLTSTEGA